ncbi:MAG TPA: tRNA pseudouridine(55) synthase TruB [bacterium]|nr:tRNA pseudouridine(55) synthase TruB [bacterium]
MIKLDGAFIVDKPEKYTSFDIVNILKKKFKLKKAGHTGTLDGLATGVLIVCVNNATKLVDYLINDDKDYSVVLRLGYKSDTFDRDGKVEKALLPPQITDLEIRKTVLSFIGEQDQIPPMYSAKKKDGKKLYKLARQGIEVTREPQRIKIDFLKINKIVRAQDNDYIDIHFDATVSKGTYIRTLCADIAKKLGTSGIMQDLRRTRVGKFTIDNAKPLKEITENDLLDISQISNLPILDIPLQSVQKFMNGGYLTDFELNDCEFQKYINSTVLVRSKGDIVIGIANVTEIKYRRIQPVKVFTF